MTFSWQRRDDVCIAAYHSKLVVWARGLQKVLASRASQPHARYSTFLAQPTPTIFSGVGASSRRIVPASASLDLRHGEGVVMTSCRTTSYVDFALALYVGDGRCHNIPFFSHGSGDCSSFCCGMVQRKKQSRSHLHHGVDCGRRGYGWTCWLPADQSFSAGQRIGGDRRG